MNKALLVLGFLLAAISGSSAAELTPFRIGISAPVVTIFPVWMGEAGGFYEKEGLKIEVVSMEGGSRGIQVLLSGEIQAMHVGLAPVVLANKQGADLRLVTSTANTIPITIFGTPTIKSMADLKGKTIGISTFGSETDIAIGIALKQAGLDRKDVTIAQIGGSSQRFAALGAGRIDAAPLLEPGITMAREKGFNALVDLAAARTPWIFDSVVVTNDFLKKNRDLLTHFIRGYVAGAYLALSNETKAKEVIGQKFRTSDAKVVDATYADFKRLMPRDAAPSPEGAKNVLSQLQGMGIQVGSTNVDDYLDLSILRDLKQNGFMAELEQRFPLK
ncbi:MAG: ABC transporter substrate-binding protein [Xanthobacteraceae bacterium]